MRKSLVGGRQRQASSPDMFSQLFLYPLADGLTADRIRDRHNKEELCRFGDAHLRQQDVQVRVQTTLENFADPVRLFCANIIRKPAAF